jgi:hypothetical protein
VSSSQPIGDGVGLGLLAASAMIADRIRRDQDQLVEINRRALGKSLQCPEAQHQIGDLAQPEPV